VFWLQKGQLNTGTARPAQTEPIAHPTYQPDVPPSMKMKGYRCEETDARMP
jgi:hypothetical protein